MENTVEHSTSKWGNKTLLTVFFSIVIGTNAFNAYIHQQEINTLTIGYNKDRSDKKDERVAKEAKQAIETNNDRQEIKRLNRELDQCK